MLIKSALRDYLPALILIRGRSADNRKAPLNFSFPLEGKCHVVAKGCTRVSIPMKLTIVLLGPTSADLETLCRVSTKRRISVHADNVTFVNKSQSAGRFASCQQLITRNQQLATSSYLLSFTIYQFLIPPQSTFVLISFII